MAALTKLLTTAAAALDRRFGWDRLPRPLGVVTLVGLRTRLREKNLYDTGTVESVQQHANGDRHLRTRTLDGSYNDLEVPTMGAVGARFGRNVPVDRTYPEPLPGLLEPNPRLVSRELLTRDEFQPATIVNVLAGAWLQFEVHDWFSHGKNVDEEPFELELGEDDDWPERPMRIQRTRPDASHRDDGSPPTYVTVDSHWWDGSQIYGSDAALRRRAAGGRGRQAPPRPGRPAPARPRVAGRPHRRRRQLLARPRAPAHALHARAQRDLRAAGAGVPGLVGRPTVTTAPA